MNVSMSSPPEGGTVTTLELGRPFEPGNSSVWRVCDGTDEVAAENGPPSIARRSCASHAERLDTVCQTQEHMRVVRGT